MKQRDTLILVAVVAGVLFSVVREANQPDPRIVEHDPVAPNWAAISSWPSVTAELIEAQPNPNRRVTAIVLDDSSSMGADIVPAKAAIVGALEAMADDDRVAVLALNAGTVLPFTTVSDARATLPGLLGRIDADGGTPLTNSVTQAQALLEAEAATVRGFGTFRLIVTTDGQANNDDALDAAIEGLAASTPIQLTTIGIDIRGGHTLRRADLGSFLDVENVDALQSALQAAVAENTDFAAITDFGTTEN